MDYTGQFLILLVVKVSSLEYWAPHSEVDLAQQVPSNISRRDAGTSSAFTAEQKEAELDRRVLENYYGPGYYVFPDINGCGGDIDARPGYQYGQLVSPNWPKPYPSSALCTWAFHGFDNIVFYFTELDLRGPRPPCNIDQLSLYFPKASQTFSVFPSFKSVCGNNLTLHEKMIIAIGLDPQVTVTATFTAKSSSTPARTGFVLTWMKFPRIGFAAHVFAGQLDIPVGDLKTGYFIHVGSTHDFIRGDVTIIMNVTRGTVQQSCAGFSAFLVDFGHNSRHKLSTTCRENIGDHLQSRAVFDVGRESKARAPWVIEVTMDEASRPWLVGSALVRYDLDILQCTFMKTDNNSFGVNGLILHTTSGDTRLRYANNTECGFVFEVPIINLWDAFIQVRVSTDIEDSHSCLFDYFLVGGRRICGHGVQYLSSPLDNMILERVGGHYVNILETGMEVSASHEPHGKNNSQDPLDSSMAFCYRSVSVSHNPHWTVNLFDDFIVHGVSIVTEPPEGTQVSETQTLTVHTNYGLETFEMECWSGTVKSGSTNLLPCHAPLIAQSVKISKKTGILSLCRVQVFINTVEPNLGANFLNVAKDTPATVYSGPPWFMNDDVNATELTDGKQWTCILSPSNLMWPNFKVDLGIAYRIFAVRIITTMQTDKHSSLNPNQGHRFFKILIHTEPFQSYEGQLCRFVSALTVDSTLINCMEPLTGRYVVLAERTVQVYICELLVYTLYTELNRNNVALHKNGAADSYSSEGIRPPFLDGDLTTCCTAKRHLHVDLGILFDVQGVIISMGNRADFYFHIRIMDVVLGEKYSDCEGRFMMYHAHVFHTRHITCRLPRVGRYVFLINTDFTFSNPNQSIAVCELQILGTPHDRGEPTDDNLVNAALYKYAVFWPRSTAYNLKIFVDSGHLVRYTARVGVDGVRKQNGTNCARSDKGKEHVRWTVDLANVFTVRIVRVIVCNQSDVDGIQYSVQLHTNNPHRLSTLSALKAHAHTECGPLDFQNDHGSILGRSRCPRATRGRYLVLVKVDFRPMCLCEVEALAQPLLSARHLGMIPKPRNDKIYRYTMNFTSDGSITGRGLEAEYSISDLTVLKSLVDCGEMVLSDNGTLLSPNHPETYAMDDDNYVCQWMVRSPVNGFVVVWVDLMHLAPNPDFPDLCFADLLMLSSMTGQQVTLCGRLMQQAYSVQVFKEEFLYVTLVVRTPKTKLPMDRSKSMGFNIRFKSYPACHNQHMVVGAGGKSTNGKISSPLYPEVTPPNALCQWTFDPHHNGSLELHFRDFQVMGGDQNCSQSAVSIISWTLAEVTYCSENPPGTGYTVKLTTNKPVLVKFRSQKASHARGFQLSYLFSPPSESDEFEVLNYRPGDAGTSTRQQLSTRLPATWIFSSLANLGRIELSLSFVPQSERSGDCQKYLSAREEYVHTGRSLGVSTACQKNYTVFPFTTWTFDFKLAGLSSDGTHNFYFSFQIENTKDHAKVFTGRVSSTSSTSPMNYTLKNDTVAFSDIILKHNIHTHEGRNVYVLEDGLYVVTLRVDPIRGHQSLQLMVNSRPSSFIAYSIRELTVVQSKFILLAASSGTVASTTGVLKLYKGDILGVRVLFEGMLGTKTMCSMIYVSPIQGGYAFTGQEKQPKLVPNSSPSLNFLEILTLVGKSHITPYYTSFLVPKTGIYWISMRTRQGGADLPNLCDNGWCSMKTFLMYRGQLLLTAVGYSRVPAAMSAAVFFEESYLFTVTQRPVSETELGSLFSFVHLSFNRKPYTSKYRHVAFTGEHPYVTSGPEGAMAFTKVRVNLGCMYDSLASQSTIIHIPVDGFYLVSLRPNSKDINDLAMNLYVNTTLTWTAISKNRVPMSQTTALRLTTGDTVSVHVGRDQRLVESTLVSLAFVHP